MIFHFCYIVNAHINGLVIEIYVKNFEGFDARSYLCGAPGCV